MPEQLQARFLPQRTQRAEEGLPVFAHQGVPQYIGRVQQRGVFVKNSQCIARRAAHGCDTAVRNLRGLQLVQALFGLREMQPAQTIEKIMQAIACGHLLRVENKRFIGLPWRQGGLGDKAHRAMGQAVRQGVQRLRATVPRHDGFGQGLAACAPCLQPGRIPIDRFYAMGHVSIPV